MAQVNSHGESRPSERKFGPARRCQGQQPSSKNGAFPGLQRPDRRSERVSPRGVLADRVGFERSCGRYRISIAFAANRSKYWVLRAPATNFASPSQCLRCSACAATGAVCTGFAPQRLPTAGPERPRRQVAEKAQEEIGARRYTPCSSRSRSRDERWPRSCPCAARKSSAERRPSSRSMQRNSHSALSLEE